MAIRSLLLVILLLGWSVEMAAAVQTVRVDSSTATPRLLVDGRPVRARMFWGAPGSGLIPIGPQGKRITFEFSPNEDEPSRATMHFRFGTTPGTIYLDDVHVVEIETGQDVIPQQKYEQAVDDFTRRWTVWPPEPQNTVGTVQVKRGCGADRSGGLQVDLKATADGQWPDFHIYHHPRLGLRKGRRYRVSLWARAEPARNLTIAFYRPGQTFVFLGGPPGPFEQQIKLAADVGVDFVSFPVSLPWPQPGQPVDFSGVDAQCQRVLNANPNALLLPRIGMAPPAWWREAHPDDVMVWDMGPQKHIGFVVASPEYRRDAAQRLAALVSHLEEAFGGSMGGYHPCGQNTGEWFYQETWGQALNGYSEGNRRAWRLWLKQRYADDAALRVAWHDPKVALETADVPSPAARRGAPAGVLRDPVLERPLIDFARFQQQMMADCVCCLARAVREATRGRKLVVFFYGYVFEFAAVRNGPATSGHYALRRVLDCPDIDVLCSPISYFDRGLGQSAPAMTAAESVALAGKMWLYEDDTRTYLGTGKFPGWQDGVDTIEETNVQLLRNTAQCALRNFGTWWMDLGATGWFNDPRMWAEMARLKALDEPLLEKPLPFQPEVAVVIDEESMIRVAASGDVLTRPGVYEVRRPLGRLGAPYGQYLQDDVAAGRVRARMVVFLTAWSLTADQRERLLAATRGSLRIWCYAPGYYDGDRASLETMSELTGFEMRKLADVSAWAEPTSAGRALGLREAFGVKRAIEPLFAAADANAQETLASYPDGSAAVALRRTEDGLSLFVGPAGLTSELLRAAARKAEVHLFTETDCNVYANGPYLALHASQDGPVDLDTGQSGAVVDLLTGEQLGPGPRVTLPMKRGDTRVLGVINRE
jgi:beta-galactosidase